MKKCPKKCVNQKEPLDFACASRDSAREKERERDFLLLTVPVCGSFEVSFHDLVTQLCKKKFR